MLGPFIIDSDTVPAGSFTFTSGFMLPSPSVESSSLLHAAKATARSKKVKTLSKSFIVFSIYVNVFMLHLLRFPKIL